MRLVLDCHQSVQLTRCTKWPTADPKIWTIVEDYMREITVLGHKFLSLVEVALALPSRALHHHHFCRNSIVSSLCTIRAARMKGLEASGLTRTHLDGGRFSFKPHHQRSVAYRS
jgi:isopenicillin N synthase-like dioxygenase